MYDPLTAQFFSPDPYVQAPDFWLNYNRYSYCLNNPLSYIDPSGESIAIATILTWVAATLGGGISNVGHNFANIMHSNNPVATGIGSFFIGALSAGGGGIVSQGIAKSIGVIGFEGAAAAAAAGSFTSGFIGGTGNALINGSSGGSAIVSGLMSGGSSALVSGLISGIGSGLIAVEHGGDFRTGKGAIFELTDASAPSGDGKIEIDNDLDYSNGSATRFAKQNVMNGNEKVNNIYADGSIPPGTQDRYKRFGDYIVKSNGKTVRGITYYLGSGEGGYSDIYLYKTAFKSKKQLYFTLVHEFLHATYFSTGIDTEKHHALIRRWEYRQSQAWSFNIGSYPEIRTSFSTKNDPLLLYPIRKTSSW